MRHKSEVEIRWTLHQISWSKVFSAVDAVGLYEDGFGSLIKVFNEQRFQWTILWSQLVQKQGICSTILNRSVPHTCQSSENNSEEMYINVPIKGVSSLGCHLNFLVSVNSKASIVEKLTLTSEVKFDTVFLWPAFLKWKFIHRNNIFSAGMLHRSSNSWYHAQTTATLMSSLFKCQFGHGHNMTVTSSKAVCSNLD